MIGRCLVLLLIVLLVLRWIERLLLGDSNLGSRSSLKARESEGTRGEQDDQSSEHESKPPGGKSR
jgi:hypothetical protein